MANQPLVAAEPVISIHSRFRNYLGETQTLRLDIRVNSTRVCVPALMRVIKAYLMQGSSIVTKTPSGDKCDLFRVFKTNCCGDLTMDW